MGEINGVSYNQANNSITIGNDFDWGNLDTDSDTKIANKLDIKDTSNLSIIFNDDDGVNSKHQFTVEKADQITLDNDGSDSVKAEANIKVTSGKYGFVSIHDTMDAGKAGMSENLDIDHSTSAVINRSQNLVIGNSETTVDRSVSGSVSYSANNTSVEGKINVVNLDAKGNAVIDSKFTLNDTDSDSSGDANIKFDVKQTYSINSSTANAAGLNAVNGMEININGDKHRTYNISGDIDQNMNFTVGEADSDKNIITTELKNDFLKLFNAGTTTGTDGLPTAGTSPIGYISKDNQLTEFSKDELSQLKSGKLSDELFNKMTVEKNGTMSINYVNEKPAVPGNFIGLENGKLQLGKDFFNSDGTLNNDKFMKAYTALGTTGVNMNQDLLAKVTVDSTGTIQLNAASQVFTARDEKISANMQTVLNNSGKAYYHSCDEGHVAYTVTTAALRAGGADVSKIPGSSDGEKNRWLNANVNVDHEGHFSGQHHGGRAQDVIADLNNIAGLLQSSSINKSEFASTTFGALFADHVTTGAKQGTVVAATTNSNAGTWTTAGAHANALMITGPDGQSTGMAVLANNGREYLTNSSQANFATGGTARFGEQRIQQNAQVHTMAVKIDDNSTATDSTNPDGRIRNLSEQDTSAIKSVKTEEKLTRLEHDPVNHLNFNVDAGHVNSILSVDQKTEGTVGTSLAGGQFVAGNKLISNIDMAAKQNTTVNVAGDSVKKLDIKTANVSTVKDTEQTITRTNSGKAVTQTEKTNLILDNNSAPDSTVDNYNDTTSDQHGISGGNANVTNNKNAAKQFANVSDTDWIKKAEAIKKDNPYRAVEIQV